MSKAKAQIKLNTSVNPVTFVKAARYGDYDTIVNLLDRDSTVLNKQGYQGFTAFNSALFALKTGSIHGKVNYKPFTPEIAEKYTKILCLLIEKGCDLELPCTIPGREFLPIHTLIGTLQSQKLPVFLHTLLRDSILTRPDYKEQIVRTTKYKAEPAAAVEAHSWVARVTHRQEPKIASAQANRTSPHIPLPRSHQDRTSNDMYETNEDPYEGIQRVDRFVATRYVWSFDPYNTESAVKVHSGTAPPTGRFR